MRIAHVTATFPPYEGGTGNVCFYNASELARRCHEVVVFTAAYPPGNGKYPPEISVRRLPIAFRFGNAPFLPGLLELDDFDLIHLHHPFIFGAEMIQIMSRVKGIPYIITHHNDLIGNGHRRYLFDTYSSLITPLVFRRASKYAVVSLDHAANCRLTPLFKQRWPDVVEIPNGVDDRIFRPSPDGNGIRDHYGIPLKAKVILFVGALDRAHHFKGLEYLIQAFSHIKDTRTYLMIIGEGDLKSTYARNVHERGLSERTIFTGNIPNQQLPAYYNAADLFVLPSFPPESFGLVLLEAMACACPVIAHDIPGVRSVISDGEDGLLVRLGDVDDMLEKLQYLLDCQEIRLEMGERGRIKVEKQYTWYRIGDRLEELYRQVLA